MWLRKYLESEADKDSKSCLDSGLESDTESGTERYSESDTDKVLGQWPGK